jgi:hypothetical protein
MIGTPKFRSALFILCFVPYFPRSFAWNGRSPIPTGVPCSWLLRLFWIFFCLLPFGTAQSPSTLLSLDWCCSISFRAIHTPPLRMGAAEFPPAHHMFDCRSYIDFCFPYPRSTLLSYYQHSSIAVSAPQQSLSAPSTASVYSSSPPSSLLCFWSLLPCSSELLLPFKSPFRCAAAS